MLVGLIPTSFFNKKEKKKATVTNQFRAIREIHIL